MSFWAQHGYGKGSKLQDLSRSGPLGGVVLSPADEDNAALAATSSTLRSDSIPYVLDPQTYVWSIPDGVARNHEDHGLAFPGLHWSAAAGEVGQLVEQVVALNRRLGTTRLLSPTCIQRSLSDIWTPLAIQLARATIQEANGNQVLVSLVLDETVLDDWRGVEDWLDVVTTLDAFGFYLIVARGSQTYPQVWEPARYGNMLRLIHRLSVLNEYEVLVGYTDVDGLGVLSAGASGIASGWYYSLRSFSEAKWQPSTGGRAARPRVLLPDLMVPVLAEAEAGALARSTLAPEAITDGDLRARLASPGSAWGLNDAWAQHLSALQQLSVEIESMTEPQVRLEWLLDRLRAAWNLLQRMDSAGIVTAPTYSTMIANLGLGLRHFGESEGILNAS